MQMKWALSNTEAWCVYPLGGSTLYTQSEF